MHSVTSFGRIHGQAYYNELFPRQAARPVLQRLRQVRRLDLLRPRQVSDGARQLEDAVVGARRKLQLAQ